MFYRPNLKGIGEGQYRSGDPIVVENHVKAMDYALADISIVSCKSLQCSCRSSVSFCFAPPNDSTIDVQHRVGS